MPDAAWQLGGGRSSSGGRRQHDVGRPPGFATQAVRGVPNSARHTVRSAELAVTVPALREPEAQPLVQGEDSSSSYLSPSAWSRWLFPQQRSGGSRGDPEAERRRRGGGGKSDFPWLSPWLGPLTNEPWRDPRVLGVCAFFAAVVTLIVVLSAPQLPQRQQGPFGPLPPQQPAIAQMPPARPRGWLLCLGPGQCGTPRMEAWAVSPSALAARVPDFSTIPGIPEEAYRPVADRWAQSPPVFRGSPVLLAEVAEFVRALLASDPFGTGDSVPFVDFRPPGEGKVAAISQRQLAFLVANAFMGNTIPASDGLSVLLRRCSAKPGASGFLYSLLSFLAVLSKELGPGDQGRMLVAATPRALDESWRQRLGSSILSPPTVCEQAPGGGSSCGMADFMSGGTPFQALTDIAGGVVGGGAQLCDIADSQDESLVQFYSEVLAFAFFTSAVPGATADGSMLPVPFTLLGARRYVRDITGDSTGLRHCGSILQQDWLNEQIQTQTVVVPVQGSDMTVSASAFVAVASACSGCIIGGACSPGATMNNQCDAQRRHLDIDLSRWYQAYEATMYDASVQEAFRRIVRRIGTGPWGAGVWYGDSQLYFLAVWLATSLLTTGTTLDYYIYSHFCENPGNQCFVLGSTCGDCIARSGAVQINAANCGQLGYREMVQEFQKLPAQALYAALKDVGAPPKQVFDLLGVVA